MAELLGVGGAGMDQLAFRAGALAHARGWTSPELIDPEELAGIAPVGEPVVVMANRELTTSQAQAIAAIHAAGRPIAVISTLPLVPAIAQWLPVGIMDAASADPLAGSGVSTSPVLPQAGHAPEAVLADEPVGVSQELISEVVHAVLARLSEIPDDHAGSGSCYHDDQDLLWADESPGAFIFQVHTRKAISPFMDDERWLDVGWEVPCLQLTAEQAAFLLNEKADWALSSWAGVHQWDAAAKALASGSNGSGDFCQHPATTPGQLRVAAEGALARADSTALKDYANDIRCPPDILEILSHHSSGDVRLAVAGNLSTERQVLLALSRDTDATPWGDGATYAQKINAAALANPRFRDGTTLPEALRIASGDDRYRQFQLASHPDAPPDVLELLATQARTDDEVAAALAFNPSTPPLLLERLAGPNGEELSWVFRARHQRDFGPPPPPPLAPFNGDWGEFTRLDPLADGAEAPLGSDYADRAAEAVNLDLTEDQLLDLAGSRILMFRLAAACHRRTSARVLAAVVDGLLDTALVSERSCPHG